MRAAIHTQYGPPDVVQIKEIEKPIPAANEVLIKVQASTVNRTDSGFRSAEYVVSRFFSGLFRPKFQTLGSEFAGTVESMGNDVTRFQSGDRVFGYNDYRFGGHGEYMVLKESDAIATMPAGISFEEAAPICEGGHYALGNIRAAKVESGQNVLVYGATGAIGSAAVQLLRHFGAHVTAVCAGPQVELVRSLGAEVVIDYTREDFTQTDTKFSFVFDAVGKSSFSQCKPLLTASGVYISTELGKNGDNIWRAIAGLFSSGKKVLFPIPAISQEDVAFLKMLVETRQFKPVVDRKYPLEQIVEAYRYVETGQKIGNVVLTIGG